MMKAVQAELKPWHKALPKKRDSLQLEINKAQVGCLQEYVLRWVVLIIDIKHHYHFDVWIYFLDYFAGTWRQ